MSKHNIDFLYVNGDSFSFGQGLKGHIQAEPKHFYDFTPELRNTCYSGIIANTWGIQGYKNASLPGGSNNRILRTLFTDISEIIKSVPAKNIFVNLSITHPARVEFLDNESSDYAPYILNFKPQHASRSYMNMWTTYVKDFDNLGEQVDRHLVQIVSMQNFLQSLGIRYLMTTSMRQEIPFLDLFQKRHTNLRDLIDFSRYPQAEELSPMSVWCQAKGHKPLPCHHVDEAAHRDWGIHLMNYMEEKGLV